MSIEVKDKGNREAAEKTIELIQKFKRHEITLCVGAEAWWTRQMLAIDPMISTMGGTTDVLKLYFGFWLGLLPFLHIDREAFLLPYQTADYIQMQYAEIAESKSLGEWAWRNFALYVSIFADKTINACLTHLQDRNIYTAYWVVNDFSELNHLMRTSTVEGIMTDRIDDL